MRPRGFTVLEVLIALAVLGVSAAGVLGIVRLASDSMSSSRAGPSQAMIDMRTIQPVAEKWRIEHEGACPSPLRLRDDRELSQASRLEDPWGSPYVVECFGKEDVRVVSFGPDKKEGTADDRRVPE